MKLPKLSIFNSVSTLEKIIFTRHLAIMLKSGLALDDAILGIKDQIKSGGLRVVLEEVLVDLNNGQGLAKSLSKFPNVFDIFYISIVKMGETSGNLEKNLEYLATHLQKSYEFRKKVQGALLYPLLILITTFIIGGGISIFVLPQLVELFKSLDADLPLTTRILLWFGEFMKSYGIIVLPGVVLLSFATYILLQTPFVKPAFHKFLLSMPMFGTLFQNIELANFCRNMGIMLKSGITLPQALDSEFQATSNLVFKDYISNFSKAVDKGKKLSSEMLEPQFKFLPKIVGKMVSVGEKSGNLEETFTYLGEFYEEEVDDTTKNLSTLLEPVLLIIIGLFVTFMALAIISPIYSITSSIRK